MPGDASRSHDAQTTPVGLRTTCPQCGVQLDAVTTTCGACGAVVTGGTMDPERAERVRARLQDGIGPGYRLGDMLGRGGMGIVFQARELSLDRDVALKVLAFDPLLNPEAYARFEREAKLAARLDHPNIVPIFSVGQGNGVAFYTMRLVRGGSAEAMIAGGQALTLDRALPILRDVASALDYAHAQGVVHRDIKPANVLIGDTGHAMVADFGIARAFAGQGGGATSATGTGVVGSPAYMSPEQWRGEKVDGRADQYALGVLAFELLSGSRPFAGDSMQELLRAHLQDDAPDIISFRDDLPPIVAAAIRRAMAKDPASRFTSASAFVAALGGTLPAAAQHVAPVWTAAASATTVRTPNPGANAGRTVPRPPAPVRTDPPPATADAPVPEHAGARRSMLPWLVLLVIAAIGGGVIWKLAPGRPAEPAPVAQPAAQPAAPAVGLDSIAALERALQQQLAEARRLALEAERRADAKAAAPASGGAPAEPRHAHLYVFAQGGSPKVVIDGAMRNEAAPAVFQLAPGRHSVAVRGVQEFVPGDTTIELAAEDTQTVVFRTARAARQDAARSAPPRTTDQPTVGPAPQSAATDAPAPGGLPPGVTRDARGNPQVDWPAVINALGFDPRGVDPRRLAPEQRLKYRKFQAWADSLRRSARRP